MCLYVCSSQINFVECRGAAQASFFTYLLFLFSNSISGYFSQQGLPDNYTARNMSVTFRTAIAGLAYLATFIFGANAAGLTGDMRIVGWLQALI